MRERVTVETLKEMKAHGRKIAMLTAYDYSMAALLDGAGVDILLVGDSLGMVALGYETTLPVTMEDMLRHTKAVAAGAERAMVVGDMPFMSYQSSVEKAVENAGAFLKRAGAHAVKLEGGREVAEVVEKIVAAGIPVMGHIGLTPQSIHKLGGYSLQAKEIKAAKRLIEDAVELQEAGAFSIVLEKVPTEVASTLTEKLEIPTIGIGAGPGCDGQVLVANDVLGLFSRFTPKFAKKYADLSPIIESAIAEYVRDVREGAFPDEEHSYSIGGEFLSRLLDEIAAEEGTAR